MAAEVWIWICYVVIGVVLSLFFAMAVIPEKTWTKWSTDKDEDD